MTTDGEIRVDLVLEGGDQFQRDMTSVDTDIRSKVLGIVTSLKSFALASVGAFVGAAIQLGDEANQAFNTIQAGTGATGSALRDLKQSAINLAEGSESSFADISKAVADVNTEFGLVGTELEGVVDTILTIKERLGEDIGDDLNTLAQTLVTLDGDTSNLNKVLNALVVASQDSGISIGELTGELNANREALRLMGIPMESAIGFIADMNDAGINLDSALGHVNSEFDYLRNANGSLNPLLLAWRDALNDNVDSATALELAWRLFGDQAPQIMEMIRNGTLDIESATGAWIAQRDAVADLDEQAQTLGRSWNMLMNELTPAAGWIGDRLSDVLDVGTSVIGMMKRLFTGQGIGFVGEIPAGLWDDQGRVIATRVPGTPDPRISPVVDQLYPGGPQPIVLGGQHPSFGLPGVQGNVSAPYNFAGLGRPGYNPGGTWLNQLDDEDARGLGIVQ